MKLKRGETNYYFSIPLLNIDIEKYDIHLKSQFAYCSIYYPSLYQDSDDYIYLIKIYDYFDTRLSVDISTINAKSLLFGESRFFPYIVTTGDMKWTLLGEMGQVRKVEEFPDLRISGLNKEIKHSEQRWFILKNCGINQDSWNQHKANFEDIKHLEFGEELNEVLVKMRIYILLIKRELYDRQIVISREEFKDVILGVLIMEPTAEKFDTLIIKEFIDSYLYDFL